MFLLFFLVKQNNLGLWVRFSYSPIAIVCLALAWLWGRTEEELKVINNAVWYLYCLNFEDAAQLVAFHHYLGFVYLTFLHEIFELSTCQVLFRFWYRWSKLARLLSNMIGWLICLMYRHYTLLGQYGNVTKIFLFWLQLGWNFQLNKNV